EEQKEAKKTGRDVEIEDGPEQHTHLWLLDVATKPARRLTGRDDPTVFTVQSLAWSPDGARIAFAAAPSPNLAYAWQSDVYLVSATDSTSTPRRLTEDVWPVANPVWSEGGRSLYVRVDRESGYRVG